MIAERVTTKIISLDTDESRRAPLLEMLQGTSLFDASIHSACPGATLPRIVLEQLAKDKAWAELRGTMGCFLSHVRAWEEIVANKHDFALILEDDIDPRDLARITEISLPPDFDIVFVNSRMSPKAKAKPIEVLEITSALEHLEYKTERKGSGGDGYILSLNGAKSLLAAIEQDGFYGHVDGRLLRYSVTENDLRVLPSDAVVAYIIRFHHSKTRPPLMGILRSFTLSWPLVWPRKTQSRREQIDQ